MSEETEDQDQNPDDGIEEVPFEEDNGPEDAEIVPETDIDLDDIEDDYDDDDEDEVPERPKPTKVDDEMLTAKNEKAVLATPKREKIVRRRSRAEIVDGVDFDDPDLVEKIWNQLEERNSGIRARKYNLKKGDYTETDVLKHDKFGKGYILEIISDGKIAVLFEEGVKKLAINRR